MWSRVTTWLGPYLAPVVIAIAVAACAASSWAGYRIGRSDGDRALVKMYQAGEKAVQKRQDEVDRLREMGREDSQRISNLRGRLYVCTSAQVPGAEPDGSPGAGTPDPRSGRDVTPIFQQFLITACQVNSAYYGPGYKCPLD